MLPLAEDRVKNQFSTPDLSYALAIPTMATALYNNLHAQVSVDAGGKTSVSYNLG